MDNVTMASRPVEPFTLAMVSSLSAAFYPFAGSSLCQVALGCEPPL
jgi:hypothetical protein